MESDHYHHRELLLALIDILTKRCRLRLQPYGIRNAAALVTSGVWDKIKVTDSSWSPYAWDLSLGALTIHFCDAGPTLEVFVDGDKTRRCVGSVKCDPARTTASVPGPWWEDIALLVQSLPHRYANADAQAEEDEREAVRQEEQRTAEKLAADAQAYRRRTGRDVSA